MRFVIQFIFIYLDILFIHINIISKVLTVKYLLLPMDAPAKSALRAPSIRHGIMRVLASIIRVYSYKSKKMLVNSS